MIEIIVMKFIRSGGFSYQEKMDIIQTINEEILLKTHKIIDQYQGKSKFRTYLAIIIQNICYEILRKKKNNIEVEIEKVNLTDEETLSPQNSIIIQQEILRLKNALEFYYKQKDKLILCLKLKFRIPHSIIDFQQYSVKITQEEFNQFENAVNPYIETTDLSIYQALVKICNKHEKKENSSDSLRKWISLKINELIEFLNGVPPASNYSEETLQILFEKLISFIELEQLNTGSN